eukprot:TRINITY_DN2755_c2_g1::TRINITY_DN2755_c2_g1_i1::g.27449::m.27449 TRINITY_DN2755_c2_g1::TRINITY_DN2755_c2_g1_i1::g.27449  ORF type:complete len:119 (+),score=7.86 TRINITY_DN2755_c2_g1_i1:259-615(+)
MQTVPKSTPSNAHRSSSVTQMGSSSSSTCSSRPSTPTMRTKISLAPNNSPSNPRSICDSNGFLLLIQVPICSDHENHNLFSSKQEPNRILWSLLCPNEPKSSSNWSKCGLQVEGTFMV